MQGPKFNIIDNLTSGEIDIDTPFGDLAYLEEVKEESKDQWKENKDGKTDTL